MPTVEEVAGLASEREASVELNNFEDEKIEKVCKGVRWEQCQQISKPMRKPCCTCIKNIFFCIVSLLSV